MARFVVNGDGNVGIGTSSPQKTLDVKGTFAISNSTTSYWDFDRDDSNGSLKIADTGTERMRIDSAGRVTMPYQPAFQTRTSGSNHTGGWNKFTGFTTNDYNTGNHWSLANHRFTAPIAGLYTFYVGGWMNGGLADTRFGYSFRINGGALTYICGGSEASVDTPLPAGFVTLSLSANDYIELVLFLAGGTRQMGTGSHNFYFGGHLLG